MIDIDRVRAETPGIEGQAYFHACGAGLMPRPVLDAVKAHLDLEAKIGGYEAEEAAREAIDRTYAALARMIGCDPTEIAIVENATRGWDMLFYSLPFERGQRILTSQAEYASNYIAYLQMAERKGVTVEVVPDDTHGQLDLQALEQRLADGSRETALISVTHVPTNGGLVNPVFEIGEIADSHGKIPVLLDACQSAGQMPLRLGQDVPRGMLSATSRKFLRGPRGVGFIYVDDTLSKQLVPPFLDLHAARWTGRNNYEMAPGARRFENWESNVAGKIGLGVAVGYALDLGLDAIRDRIGVLAGRMRDGLVAIPGVTVRDQGTVLCGIVSFTVDGTPPRSVAQQLRRQGIVVGVSEASSTLLDMTARGLESVARAGVHVYNDENEVDRLVESVADLAA